MEKISKLSFIKFLIYSTIFSLLTLLMYFFEDNFSTAIQLSLLIWSCYILCIPAFHGKTILGLPYKFLTGKTLHYPEVYLWLAALGFNIFEMIQNPTIYFKTFVTHFLYLILSSMQIQWLIIVACALGTFYKLFVGYQNFYHRKFLHYLIRSFLIALGIFTLIYLSYKELIILINIRA
ncbi:hypothetical protein GF322_05090 [Candidatus Dependentiae bacterium]|nr:hypothetical protein [Candidatus Dependentiae bacterium]